MKVKVDDTGMHIFINGRGREVLKYSPMNDTVWPTCALGYKADSLVDLHEAMSEVLQLRLMAKVVESPKFQADVAP